MDAELQTVSDHVAALSARLDEIAQDIEAGKGERTAMQRGAGSADKRLLAAELSLRMLRSEAALLKFKVGELEDGALAARELAREAFRRAESTKQILDTLEAGREIYIARGAAGVLRIGSTRFDEIYELYDFSNTSVKVRSGLAHPTLSTREDARILGQVTRIQDGTAWNGVTPKMNTAMTISETTYIYVKLDRSAPLLTLEIFSSVPQGDDTNEYYPLWYIPWDRTASMMGRNQIRKLHRGMIHVEAF